MLQTLVIVSGLSGSGKSSALNALEDLGYYAIDNLPIKLFDKLAELFVASSSEINKLAIVMDLRDSAFVENYPQVFRNIQVQHRNVEIVYLEASDEVLTRRFSETRRKHPLSSKDVTEGIRNEKKLLSDLKDLATTVIDTSSMDVHALKKRMASQFGQLGQQGMQIRLISFGFKYGTPKNCDLIFDVRFLSNPHFVADLRSHSGQDPEVADFIRKDSRTNVFLAKVEDLLSFVIPQYAQEGKSYLSVGFGCTGGKHRSVYIAEELQKRLQNQFQDQFPLQVEHQDLGLSQRA